MTNAIADSSPRLSLSQLLAGKPSWSLKERLVLVRRLTSAIQALHRQGQIHRSLDAATITIDERFEPQLPLPGGPCRFGGDHSDPEYCPPELAHISAVEVPAEINAATAVLRERGISFDPRRIDVYQIGVVFCQLLTDEPFLNYLYSPTCKAKVPPIARTLLESCLGEISTGLLVDCDGLLEALDHLICQFSEKEAAPTSETPPSGNAIINCSDTPSQGKVTSMPTNRQTEKNLPFQKLGHFQIIEQIGSGGMGDVYKGYDASLDRFVAIKVLAAPLARDEQFVMRFNAEATAAAKLSHPNVVPIFYIGQDAGYHFFAMQFIQGKSLAQRLASERRIPVDEAVSIIEQCLSGLEAAHAQGMIHRDIKPGNILLEQTSGRAVIVDFGLVRDLNAGSRMTATGVMMGTVDYIAPEQARGQAVDCRSDIYSLGITFYEMLSGRLPFVSESPTSMIFKHAYEDSFPLKQAASHVPQSLVDIITRMMAKEASERYPSCASALTDLRAFREGEYSSASSRRSSSDDDKDVVLPFMDEVSHLPLDTPWQRTKDWIATMFGRYVPEFIQELRNTTIQMDAAVADYERRRDRLANLLEEARRLKTELPPQQIEELESQLHKANADLARLRSQQNLLKARLKAAEAHCRMEGVPPRRSHRLWLLPLGMAIGVLLLLWWFNVASEISPQATEFAVFASSNGGVVREGVGWGNFRIGASREELVKYFGPPDTETDSGWVQWKTKYHIDCRIDKSRGAYEIRFSEGFDLPLASGVKIGSPENAVLSAYGTPDRIERKPTAKMLQYNNHGVLLWIKDERVFDFRIIKPHGTEVSRKSDQYVKRDLLPEHDPVNLSGSWELTMPRGFQRSVEITFLKEGRYRIANGGNMNGVYEIRGDTLVMTEPNDKRLTEFVWQIASTDRMVLIEAPPVGKIGSDYRGATLNRSAEIPITTDKT